MPSGVVAMLLMGSALRVVSMLVESVHTQRTVSIFRGLLRADG